MAVEKEIYDFAVKYRDLFADPQTTGDEVAADFIAQCFELGFEMDDGKRFTEVYPEEALKSNEALTQIIDSIGDVKLLESAISCNLRYIMYWTWASPLDEEYRQWFITALGRLAAITEEKENDTGVFTGTLQKMYIASANAGIGPRPAADEEVRQCLTITAQGHVELERFSFGIDGNESDLIERCAFDISSEAADDIMEAVSDHFSKKNSTAFATDIGVWSMTLTNTEGQSFRFSGSLFGNRHIWNGVLSELIRSRTGRDDLFAFDGNPDGVERVEVDYHRVRKAGIDTAAEGEVCDDNTWHSNEKLSIDRKTETIVHCREIGSGCKITNTYCIQHGVGILLDTLNTSSLTTATGNPPDAVFDPLDEKSYTITVYSKQGKTHTVNGSFDKNGLPVDWEDFINTVAAFLSAFGAGELFDERVYGKVRRRASDLIFCNVTFNEGGRTYCYLADTDDYCEGDRVVVPAGPLNEESVVRIESIEYHPAKEAPYPLEKIKHILRKYDGDFEDIDDADFDDIDDEEFEDLADAFDNIECEDDECEDDDIIDKDLY